ncbi:3442_t:CDS:2 [Entrophospora sp. SA101]|nr:4298_t:CDS:2 [Entrophospora sp. SA101]CAJ0645242.1 11670_t:CDS:2 [Entrophospora sp. SA101]CAJ0749723.1 24182_t:CDS:2 [Entrophospora sp. SA101]CAJ0759846.1 3442_t:CDS:2 [Entrophospora sp. SA101]CAJ0909715.1 18018_t:CDS:2 [Entrophospora sp. SA101]
MAQVGGDNGAAEDATSTIIEKLKPAISETKQVIGHAAQKSKNWFTYGVIALNAIPLTILLTFLFVTTSIVVLIIGTRIFLAKGFFIGVGSFFFVPVMIIMIFASQDNTTSLSFDTQHILSKTSKVLTGGKEGGIGGDASRGKKNLIEEIIILLY